jgi:hypothetical protein
VEFVHEQETDGGEGGGPGGLGEEKGEALGGGDEDVGRFFSLGGAVLGGRVAGAGGDAEVAPAEFGERGVEIFLEIVGEGAERGDVDGDDAGGQAGGRFVGAYQVIKYAEKGGEGFPGAGGRREQDGATGENVREGGVLSGGGGAEAAGEPDGKGGMQATACGGMPNAQ